ncbi:rhodanese-like domain-containing protein [Streptomyces sp. NPDC047515]|uniref:rhodanese-like domain-containing protein n=1 Tax=Streptomyces sp. NPDC047515 TaxID=3155380 RepID=UPI0033EB678C
MREVDLTVFAAELANGAFVIDVREPDEYRAGHVPGAHPAPLSELGAVVSALPRGRTVYVICASGNRSGRAVEHLEALGVDAVPVAGGTAVWARAGHSLDHGVAAAESA